jgi:hypothetical protein
LADSRFLGDTNRCHRCRGVHEFAALGPEYVYLLGLYLGDGHISEHPREVYKLRLFLDAAYPEILREASQAIGTTRGRAPGSLKKGPHCVEVYSFWRQWPCFFPQHGSGLKHERPIELSRWQRARPTAAGPSSPWPHPFGWLSLPKHRPLRVVAPAVFVQEPLE